MKKWSNLGWNTISWLNFEKRVSFIDAIKKIDWYRVEDHKIFFRNEKVAEIYKKNDLYKRLLEPNNINYQDIISQKLLPDNAVYVLKKNTVFIIEIKYQHTEGSVDEKLQTCDFKLKQYKRLLWPLKYDVKYCYVLNRFFMKPKYEDVINYIQAVGCNVYFRELPLLYLGLPLP